MTLLEKSLHKRLFLEKLRWHSIFFVRVSTLHSVMFQGKKDINSSYKYKYRSKQASFGRMPCGINYRILDEESVTEKIVTLKKCFIPIIQGVSGQVRETLGSYRKLNLEPKSSYKHRSGNASLKDYNFIKSILKSCLFDDFLK